MDPKGKILLADRNRHVRKYLERELAGEGYQVILAGEGRELLQLLARQGPFKVLVLDPDIPSYLPTLELLKLLHCQHPAVPIVIHTFLPEDGIYAEIPGVEVCVEKSEDVTLLKKVIADLIHKYYPAYQSSLVSEFWGEGASNRGTPAPSSKPPQPLKIDASVATLPE